jgi:hypothetical protein
MPDVGEVGYQQPFADDQVTLRGAVRDLVDLAHRDVVVELQRQFLLRVAGLHLVTKGDVWNLQLLPDHDEVRVGQMVDHSDHWMQTSVAVEPLGQLPQGVAALDFVFLSQSLCAPRDFLPSRRRVGTQRTRDKIR